VSQDEKISIHFAEVAGLDFIYHSIAQDVCESQNQDTL
jgi:hypothetical protein